MDTSVFLYFVLISISLLITHRGKDRDGAEEKLSPQEEAVFDPPRQISRSAPVPRYEIDSIPAHTEIGRKPRQALRG
jgi:hypothetical protein